MGVLPGAAVVRSSLRFGRLALCARAQSPRGEAARFAGIACGLPVIRVRGAGNSSADHGSGIGVFFTTEER